MLTFLEFFAGGGMARAGLGAGWNCSWANDFSTLKAEVYAQNWGAAELHVGDVAKVSPADLPNAFLAWASFPCQDLSLAGAQVGIGHHKDEELSRSGTFWPFWKLIRAKRPPVVVIENVVGALTSNKGADIRAICSAISDADYRFGPLVMDAASWLPHSRPRLFIVAVRRGVPVPDEIIGSQYSPDWHPAAVGRAYGLVTPKARRDWIWWSIPKPVTVKPHLEDIISVTGDAWVDWDSKKHTEYLLSMMSPLHREKIRGAQALGRRVVGTAYRRTRQKVQRAEVRFDGIAGCLRTAGGGSSRQIVFEVTGRQIRTRLISPREAARLQGLPDSYWLPEAYNDAYDLVGDGLSVPVVAYLRAQILDKLAQPALTVAIA